MWGTESSDDPNVIKAWGSMHPDKAYFCVALRQSGLTAIDIDIKDGKQGLDTLLDIELEYGDLPATIKVQTPSGGYYYLYKGDAKFGVNRLGPGADVPVMTPLPNSEVYGKGQYKLLSGTEPTPLPQYITDIAGIPNEPKENPQESLIEEDQDHNIQRAIDYLKTAKPAVSGEGGNSVSYNVLCRVRDYGVTEALCLDLAHKYYNNRCVPPWSNAELERIAKNVYAYAQSPPGATDPTQDFDPIIPDTFTSFSELTRDVSPPNWLIKRYFEKDTITLIYGDSGAYKSFLAIDIGLHVAIGTDWLKHRTSQGPVFYIAGEGHGGIKRRLRAFKDHYKVKGQVPFYVSKHAIQIHEANSTKQIIKDIKATAANPEAVIIDTLATSFGSGDENSTKDMNTFLNHVQTIRKALGCTVLIVHHTGHQAKERPRGAYALMAGVDSFYGVEKTEEGLTCLRSPRKMKDGEPVGDTWFKTKGVTIGVDEDKEPVTSLILEYLPDYREPVKDKGLGLNQNLLLEVLRDHNSLNIDLARKEFKAKKDSLEQPYSRQSFHRAIKSLEEKSIIESVNGILKVKE